MKTGLSFVLIVAMALLFVQSAHAKEDRFPVSVDATADDMVGRRLVYKVKEELRRSASMRLVDSDEAGMRLFLVTLPRFPDDPSLSTVFSAVWTLEHDFIYPVYITSVVGYCGGNIVESQAESLVAQTDKVISDLKSVLKAVRNTTD
ncbi:hypothetical protein OO006_06660 [Prosthecochloris sp. SCSIO W1101]|uniref:hypothetical protein n=1 Tax=Prosthecochloris sp. SCSIO W1101 TaxID=2992242 RepID=UPI00223E241E|nr:hypothetical protein [Prosthecochloris sp. SCSIO W1101]UZJ42623.1 hypothetical protein OO006_06660 [Prosthecochloris sp. SCSIO W1101]